MCVYWPMMVIRKNDPDVFTRQSSYNPCHNIEEAEKVIECWKNGYYKDQTIAAAWIDVYDLDNFKNRIYVEIDDNAVNEIIEEFKMIRTNKDGELLCHFGDLFTGFSKGTKISDVSNWLLKAFNINGSK